MQLKNVDWIGLVSGILLVAVILTSLSNPWWQLRIGDLGYVNSSPLNTHFSFLGTTFSIPLVTAINITCLLLLSISAALMIAYAVNPTKEYSKQLLCWSYKPPVVILIMFIVGLVILSPLVSFFANQYVQIDFNLPIIGTSIIQVPAEMLGGLIGIQINIAISGMFQWTYILAIAATVFCITTRILYGKASVMTKHVVKETTTSV